MGQWQLKDNNTNIMLLDNYIANFLIKKKVSIKLIKNSLSLFYILINSLLYYKVFYKMNSSWIGLVIFLLVTIPFGYFRSMQLNKYITEKQTSH